MFDYKLLEALACVVHEQGFDKASGKLHITQSAVSQRIKLLEDQVGQVLVTRTAPPKATRDGKRLLKHYMQVKSLEADLEQSMETKGKKHFQVFPIGINADSLATWFFPAISTFLRDHKILLDLKVDDQNETHKMLRNGEVAGCISSEKTSVQGCRVTALGTMTYRLAATNHFVKEYFPQGLDELSVQTAPAVIFNRKDDLHAKCFKKRFKTHIMNIPVNYVPSSEKFAWMIMDGLAYGMIPDLQGLEHIKSGLLVDIAPTCHIGVKLYWHRWSLSSRFLDDFSRAIEKNEVIC
ncbi:MAG: LysR family transcriptional regulator ArgP [Deltaproteobacteria bacterium]|nr:MAG: LysR family transcriptional regulator ArgP [Deltaproteobacteria bacterium]RLC24427.1 MAG: LysR family transcriptional regulator ArgP [Deltaproteobacteria bacterium]